MPGAPSLDILTESSAPVSGAGCFATVLKRDGRAVPFDRERIVRAIEMALCATLRRFALASHLT